jgi:hypothetical protein
LGRTKNRPIVTKENSELIYAARELSVCLQGRKDNICDIAAKNLDAGLGWLSNFKDEIDMISDACVKNVQTPAFGVIDMVDYDPPRAVAQHKRV